MTISSNGNQPAALLGSALYVDTENLGDSENARQVVAAVVGNWPSGRPPLRILSLYVRADKAELWRLWVEEAFPRLRHRVRGVQHFSNNRAKNSADLAITADAVADLVTGHADAVAVASNDSDFGALFVKVRELAEEAEADLVPFLWITVPTGGALSAEIAEFIPDTFRWDLSATLPPPSAGKPGPQSLPEAHQPPALAAAPAAASDPGNEAIADELIQRLPVGKFKVTEALEVFQERWPSHPDAAGPEKFGTFLLEQIWPILRERGVLMTRKRSPRAYQITSEAKASLEPSSVLPTQPPSAEPTAAEPSPASLAAAVAAAITDDVFKSADAQAAIKARWPQHSSVGYTAQRFGSWFAEQLWPVMEQHGVVIAKEKPRSYEMTPDARSRLTALA